MLGNVGEGYKLPNIKYFSELNDRTASLEARLLQYYILCEMLWSLVNAIAYSRIGMPKITIRLYFIFFVSLVLFWVIARLIKKEKLFVNLYFVIVLLINPFMWYFSGGARASANILFLNELILFVMCMKGKKQIVFVILSLMSTSIAQGVARNMPNPVFPMEPQQYQMGGSVMGITTSLLVAALLIRQKSEYTKEREAVITSEKNLERSNSLQKNFLANMSHEIRSPLGIVMGFNNLIKDSNDVDQIHEYSNDISRAGSTLLTVINDILDYSKIESGKLDIIEVDYSLDDLIKEVSRDISLKCEEKGLNFTVNIPKKLPDRLIGDSIRIKQCLINILTNAVKYTEKGEVTFEINSISYTIEDGYRLRFVIKDTGRGIKKEAIPNLYSAFQRLDEGMNRGIEGTGLGLAITKNLLDEMNGVIEVESEIGVGTIFTIELNQKEGRKQMNDVSINNSENLNGLNILVVDDTPLNLVLVKKLLEKEGAKVKTIDNGKDCLIDIEDNKYDAILLDHMMPDMNGVEVFEEMKRRNNINSGTPIIMLTANAMSGAMKEYMDMGFDGYLSKPIVAKDLKDMILRLTKRISE